MLWPRGSNSSHGPPFLFNHCGKRFSLDRDRMEALRFFRNPGLGPVEPDGGSGVRRSLWIGDLAGEHDAALNGFGQHRLARFGILVPAERLAGQERVPEPLESNERMT